MQANVADPQTQKSHTVDCVTSARQVHQDIDFLHPKQVAQARNRTREIELVAIS